MKRYFALPPLLVLFLLPATFGCQMKAKGLQESSLTLKEQSSPAPKDQSNLTLKDQKDKTSYSLGLDIGRDLKPQELGANIEPLLQGIRDGLQGNKPLLSDEELEQVRKAFLAERLAARAKALGPQAEKNLAEGEAFLRENAKKEGVKTLSSGLQYRVLKSGTGATPGPEKNVKAHYIVRSIDSTELENTYKSGNPAIFPVRGVIPAWTEALQMMKEGDKWELFVPASLAYGEKGVGKAIGPFQAVIFEIELISIH